MKKAPANFYTTVNQKKLNTRDIVDLDTRVTALEGHGYLPDVDEGDAGKILKVDSEGAWGVGEDENTIIIPNPEEGSATEELQTLQVGATIYAVNKPSFETIKGLRITIENGGQYNTNKPIIEFYDDGGNKANITSSEYTVTCDKTYAGNAELQNVCSIQTPETPGAFTYIFVNDFNTSKYHFIKLTRGGTFLTDIAKNIKIELTADGENWLTLWEETSITWSDAVTYHIIDIDTGSESSTLLPIVTSDDNGKVLTVVNGVWDKANSPAELPDAYQHIRIVNRESSLSGAWSKDTSDPDVTVFTGSLDTTKFKAYGRKPFGTEVDITNDFDTNKALCNYPNATIEFDFQLSELKIVVIPISSMTSIRKASLQLLGSFEYIGVMYNPVDKNYGIAGKISITFNSDYSIVTITVEK